MTAISINETKSFADLGIDPEVLRMCIGKQLITSDALDVLYRNILRGWTTAQNADSALAAIIDAWRDGRGFKQHRRDNAKARRSPVAALLDERAVRRQRDLNC